MDIVRLAIVYDTSLANARLVQLNNSLAKVHTNNTAASRSMLMLVGSVMRGEISVREMFAATQHLGKGLGALTVGLAVVVTGLLLIAKHFAKSREEAIKFANQLRDVTRKVNDLLRLTPQNPAEQQIRQITDAIEELDRKIAQERGNIFERLFGSDATLKSLLMDMGRFFFGGPSHQAFQQRGALAGQRERLSPQALLQHDINVASMASNQARTLNILGGGSQIDVINDRIQALQKLLKQELVDHGLDPLGDEVIHTAAQILELQTALRKAEREAKLLEGGLNIASDAIEDFVITGTLAFTDFLNNILRLLYRDAAQDLIGGILRRSGSAGTLSSGDSTGGADVGVKMGPNPSVQTNVNFTIQAIDTQSGAAWIKQNAPTIAAEVGAQAARAAGLRRQFNR